MEGNQLDVTSPGEGVAGRGDLTLSRQKDQDIVTSCGTDAVQGVSDPRLEPFDVRKCGRTRYVSRVDGIDPPRCMDESPADMVGHPLAGQRRGHHDKPARASVQEEREQQIYVEAALVELIEDNRGELTELALTQHSKHDAGRGEKDLRIAPGPVVVSNAVSDLRAKPTALEIRDPQSEAPTGHPSGLDDEHPALLSTPAWDLCGLPGARWGGDDHGALGESDQEILTYPIDREAGVSVNDHVHVHDHSY